LEAIDSGVDADIVEELGDLLLQVVLHSQIAADEGRFDLIPVVDGISEKLIRRHPHVFANVKAETAGQVVENWEQIKKREKQRESLLSGVPNSMPALSRASRISEKASRVGYDWPVREMLFDKLNEELGELAQELFPDGKIPKVASGVDAAPVPDAPIDDPERLDRAEDELGDVLFVVANIARRWGINPEEALRRTNRKFERRFAAIEQAARAAGKRLEGLTIQEMEAHYQVARQAEKAGGE
ncbi:MAG: nucleoside triphosphate pyrophosphohydrolase, partial [Chrysiogenetes bacterium]|nr:nucleoside triphosphate pyrophosphohydrolase [Chrysiogenetes bacterium]